MIEQFIEAIRNVTGGAPSLSEIVHGKIIRFATNDRKDDDAGWCLLFDDGKGGAFGCWRQGISETWQARQPLTDGERTAFRVQVKKAQEEAKRQREQERAECRKRSAELWEQCRNAERDHPYLLAKGVNPYGIRQFKESLMVPVRSVDGILHGLQFISADGTKKFKTGTDVQGCYHSIGKPNGNILVAEGYATAATLHEITGHAVACAFNAGNLKPVAEALRAKLPETTLIICADDDAFNKDGSSREKNTGILDGTEAARAVNGLLAIPDFAGTRRPDDSDFNDLAKLSGPEAVRACIESARTPSSEMAQNETLQQAVSRLAALDPLEYEKVRKAEAKNLGIERVSALDVAVKAARKAKEESEDNNLFPGDDPWGYPVDGQTLIIELAATFERFSVLPQSSAITAALWTILSYCPDYWNILPLLSIISPEKRCGKTTFLTTLGKLCYRALPVSNISPAAVYRSIDAFRPSLLIDEGDTFLRDNEELRGVINSGHTKGAAFVIRCEGDDNKPVRFSTWCSKAIAMIGNPPDTIRDRSIMVSLRRKLSDEVTEQHSDEHNEDFDRLRAMILRWIEDNETSLRLAIPARLNTSNDRQADNWRPLLAIAQVAGCDEQARKAALSSVGEEREEQPAKIQLLQDIRDIFQETGEERLPSSTLTRHLVALEDRPWSEWNHGKPITATRLSKLLAPFSIRSTTIRFTDGLAKGYTLSSFTDAFKRYTPPIQNVTPLQANNINRLDVFQNVTDSQNVTFQNQDNSAESLQCYDVTDQIGEGQECIVFDENDFPEEVAL